MQVLAWERISGCKTVVWSRPGGDSGQIKQWPVWDCRGPSDSQHVESGQWRGPGRRGSDIGKFYTTGYTAVQPSERAGQDCPDISFDQILFRKCHNFSVEIPQPTTSSAVSQREVRNGVVGATLHNHLQIRFSSNCPNGYWMQFLRVVSGGANGF